MRRVLLIFSMTLLSLSLISQAAEVLSQAQQESPPSVSLNPASLDFGDQVVKRPSKPQRITVTNSGGKLLYVNSATITGDNRSDFSLTNDTCTGATIAPGKSCVLDVAFTPTATERRAATLTLNDNAPDSPQQIALTGNGINSVRVPPDGTR